jgi:DNA modification methylase
VKAEAITFAGSREEALRFSITANKDRRHLDSSQKACIAVLAEPFFKAIEDETEKKRRERISENNGMKERSSKKLEDRKENHSGYATEKVAQAFNTNNSYVSQAKKLKEENPGKFNDLLEGKTNFSQIKKEEKQEKLEKKKEEIIKKESESVKKNTPIVYNKSAIDFLNTFKDNSIDLLLTDPPYSTDVKDISKYANEWVNLALKKVKKNGRGYICIGAYPIELKAYLDVFLSQDKFILDNPLIWTYRNTLGVTPKDKYNLNYQVILHFYSKDSRQLDTSITNEMFSVQDINAPDGRQGDRLHTWQKPIELGNRLVRHSTKDNDIVVDPFCCTGTFLLSASTYGCKAIGNDINIDNLKIAEKRGAKIEL